MPHLTLEYSANVTDARDFSPLFARLHDILHHTGGIRRENCKSRARRETDFYIADGDPRHAFVHLSVCFLEGRSPEVKAAIGREMLQALAGHFAPALAALALQITVEICDIQRATYFKIPGDSIAPNA